VQFALDRHALGFARARDEEPIEHAKAALGQGSVVNSVEFWRGFHAFAEGWITGHHDLLCAGAPFPSPSAAPLVDPGPFKAERFAARPIAQPRPASHDSRARRHAAGVQPVSRLNAAPNPL
jgi:hypothetical protein